MTVNTVPVSFGRNHVLSRTTPASWTVSQAADGAAARIWPTVLLPGVRPSLRCLTCAEPATMLDGGFLILTNSNPWSTARMRRLPSRPACPSLRYMRSIGPSPPVSMNPTGPRRSIWTRVQLASVRSVSPDSMSGQSPLLYRMKQCGTPALCKPV
jgi:hypothetical protein